MTIDLGWFHIFLLGLCFGLGFGVAQWVLGKTLGRL